MLRHALNTSMFFSFCSVLGKLEPRHITIGGSFGVFLRNECEPVSQVAPASLDGGGGFWTNGDRPCWPMRSEICVFVVGHSFTDGEWFAREGLVEWMMGLTVAAGGGEFFSSEEKSIPLCELMKLLFPPNSSSSVCIPPEAFVCEPDLDHESRFEKSNEDRPFPGEAAVVASDGELSTKDMYIGSLARMLNTGLVCFPKPKSRFIASSVAVDW